jgi:hypothetical protein
MSWFRESYRHSLASRGYISTVPKIYRKKVPLFIRRTVPGDEPRVGKKKAVFSQKPKKMFIKRSLKAQKVSPRMKVIYGVNKITRRKEIQAVVIDTRRALGKGRRSLAEYYNIAPEVR